jgi:ribosome recycling factor
MLDEIYQDVREQMRDSLESLRRDYATIRTGRASTAMLEGLRIDYYGTATPLTQVANLSVPEPRLLTIRPYEQNLISDIEKVIRSDASLGLNPSNDGTIIRVPIPELTGERRIEITKVARSRAEDGRVAVRHARREGIDLLQQAQKEGEVTEDDLRQGQDEIQKITDEYIEQVDQIFKTKEEEIMEV